MLRSPIFNMYLHFAKVKHTMKKTNNQNSRLYPTSINIRLDRTFFSIWRLKWSIESPAIRERDKQEHTIATPGNRIQATEPIGTYLLCKDALAWLPSHVKHKYIMRTEKDIHKRREVYTSLSNSYHHLSIIQSEDALNELQRNETFKTLDAHFSKTIEVARNLINKFARPSQVPLAQHIIPVSSCWLHSSANCFNWTVRTISRVVIWNGSVHPILKQQYITLLIPWSLPVMGETFRQAFGYLLTVAAVHSEVRLKLRGCYSGCSCILCWEQVISGHVFLILLVEIKNTDWRYLVWWFTWNGHRMRLVIAVGNLARYSLMDVKTAFIAPVHVSDKWESQGARN